MSESSRRPGSGPPLIFSLIWLVYLVIPLVQIFDQPAKIIAAGLTAVIVFIVIYVCAFRFERYRFNCTIALIVMVGLFTYTDESSIYMAFYTAPLIGMQATRKQVLIGTNLMAVLFGATIWYWKMYNDESLLLQYLPAMIVMLFIPFALLVGQRSKDLRKKLNLANEEIARLSKNEERQRISRDLHDTLGHTLSLITLKSELAEKLILKHPERAVQEVKDIQTTSRAALRQVRELVSGMSALTVRDELAHAKQILSAAGIVLDAEGDYEREITSATINNILGMCLREAVTNVVKHSKAKLCTVGLDWEGSRLTLSVTDNGTGLSKTGENGVWTDARGGNGIKGMRERLKLIEGSLAIESIGRGTRLTMSVPIVAKEA
ncbi:two-component system sensor histidine kinase DesK [Paenibacillus taihuensis]|uniref:histidine kinase n=1 Tax=Paenibacillus taihuensis TaxID=1156355 RepID=A0A3D9RPE1_9BACL|nr:sensor histidine kinase [Paenibacillus taihuensis]REE78760.1 two-component system sensor histidine kinase DesK [Paenibacillus taihuensis]